MNGLERPLVGHQDEDEHVYATPGSPGSPGFGAAAAGFGSPASGAAAAGFGSPASGAPDAAFGSASSGAAPGGHGRSRRHGHRLPAAALVPSLGEDLQETTALGREAAEILWSLQDASEPAAVAARDDVRAKATQLHKQLRGLIADGANGDAGEETLAHAFEVFDMLSRALEPPTETQANAQPAHDVGTASPASAEASLVDAAPAPATQPKPAAAAAAAAAEAPLIDFD